MSKERGFLDKDKELEIFEKLIFGIGDENKLDKDTSLGVKQEYLRKLYDDSLAKKKAKDELFKGGKIAKEQLTATIVHSNREAALRKYGKKHYAKHIVESDHINPLQKVHATYKDNIFLTDADVKKIANMKANLRAVTKEVNNSKLQKTNVEYVKYQVGTVEFESNIRKIVKVRGCKIKIDSNKIVNFQKGKGKMTKRQAVYMLSDQVLATVAQRTYATGLTIKNISASAGRGIKQEQNNILINLSIKATQEMIQVVQGKKDIKQAGKEIGELGAKLTLQTGLRNVATEGITVYTRNNSKNTLVKQTSNFLKNKTAGVALTVAATIGESSIALANGEISGEEFMARVMVDGSSLLATNAINSFATSMALGPQVAVLVLASLVISTTCNYLISQYQQYKAEKKAIDGRVQKVNALAREALREMEYQRNILKSLIQAETEHWEEITETAFQEMYAAILGDDVDKAANSLDKILSLFGEQVRFKDTQTVKNSILAKEEFVF